MMLPIYDVADVQRHAQTSVRPDPGCPGSYESLLKGPQGHLRGRLASSYFPAFDANNHGVDAVTTPF